MDSKVCTKCKRLMLNNRFSKQSRTKDGLSYTCKECDKSYQEINNERIKAKKIEYRLNNKEKIRIKDKAYYLKNKEKIYKQKKIYDQNNRESNNRIKEAYRARNREKVRKSSRDYALRSALELNDSYIKMMLVQGTSISKNDVPQELVDLKRVQVMITRKLKEIKSCNQPQLPT